MDHIIRYLLLLFLAAGVAACGVFDVRLEVPGTEPTPTPTQMGGAIAAPPTPAGDMDEPGSSSPAATPTPQDPGFLIVVYLKNGNVWKWTEQQGSTSLTSPGNVTDLRLSDDGRIVAFLRQIDEYHRELWAVNTDGSGERRLVNAAQLDNLDIKTLQDNFQAIIPDQMSWVPGEHILAFNTRQVGEGPGTLKTDDLRLVNADTQQLSTLLPAGQGGDFYFSPDGSAIALVTPTTIGLVDANGNNFRLLLSYEEVLTYSEARYYAQPVWASDSSSLRVAIPSQDPLAEFPQPAVLWSLPRQGPPAIRLGSISGSPFFGTEVHFSPDLSLILYSHASGEPANNLRELHIAQVDGSQDRIYLTAPLAEFIGWAGSSTHFVFVVEPRREFQFGMVAGSYRPLSSDPFEIAHIRWLDSERFLSIKHTGGDNWNLRLQDISGAVTIIDTVDNFSSPYDFQP